MMETENHQITYVSEIARKTIHLASLFIPIIYLHIDHALGIGILLAMTATSFLIDVGRQYHEPTRILLMKLVGPLLRTHEVVYGRFRLTGATWVLIAATLTLGVFTTVVAVTAFTILIVSDTLAALIGRRYGKKNFLDKSVVGSITFALSAVGVVAVYGVLFHLPTAFWIAGIIGSVVGAVSEAASARMRLDDNISIPFAVALVMVFFEWLFVSNGGQSFIYLIP